MNNRSRHLFEMKLRDHEIDLATALGEAVPDLSGGPKGRSLRASLADVARIAPSGRSMQSSRTSNLDRVSANVRPQGPSLGKTLP